MRTSEHFERRRLIAAGTTLGIGMGGFFDGILFHQILQVHNMLSNRVPRDSLVNEEINMFWDGLFHAFCFIVVLVGLGMLWRVMSHAATSRLPGRSLVWSMILGWGIFNVVEGLIDHEILGVHHVFQNGNHVLWDVVFLVFGVGLVVSGWLNLRGDTRDVNQQEM